MRFKEKFEMEAECNISLKKATGPKKATIVEPKNEVNKDA